MGKNEGWVKMIEDLVSSSPNSTPQKPDERIGPLSISNVSQVIIVIGSFNNQTLPPIPKSEDQQ